MRTHEDLVFDLEREEQKVTISGKKYVLVELSGEERDSYLNDIGGRMRIENGKPAGIKNFNGMQAFLVSLSLKSMETGEPVPVNIKEIQKWPAPLVSKLFDRAKALSAIDQENEERKEKKNKIVTRLEKATKEYSAIEYNGKESEKAAALEKLVALSKELSAFDEEDEEKNE